MTAQQILNRVFNGQNNFMTPTVISTRKNGETVAELSQGEGFGRSPIYGVTVVKQVDGKWVSDYARGQMFHDRAEAVAYYNSL